MVAPIHVPLLDLRQQYAPLRDEIQAAINAICDSQRFVLGEPVQQLEMEICEYVGASHAVGVSSGTDALLAALMALEIQPGDEVITTPYTFFATVGTIVRLGARPLFCDIELPSFNLSVAELERLLDEDCDFDGQALRNRQTGGRIKALMPVHLYGQMLDMRRLTELAKKYRLAVVEDAAQAIGAELADGARAGSVGDVGCFSFFPTKNLGAFGDAGMCVTSDPDLATMLEILRVHGGERRYFHSVVGGNFRIDALQAAVLSIKLKHLDQWTQRRRANAALYDRLFAEAELIDTVSIPVVSAGYRHIFNQYVIRVPARDALKRYLTENGVGTEIYYPLPLHQQECFEELGYSAEAFPNAREAAATSLALPIFPELTSDQIGYVVTKISDFYREHRDE